MQNIREPFLFLRILMALSSLAPLFLLVAIKGSDILSDWLLATICFLAFSLPGLFLALRVQASLRNKDKVALEVQRIEDSTDHLLVYLFAVLVPLFQANLDSIRGILLFLSVLLLVVYLFVHLRLYYANLIFALRGYKIFTLVTREGERVALITKREKATFGQGVFYRVTNFIYMEVEEVP